MRQIDKIIKSQSEPKDTNVLWLDTSGENPILKEYEGGEWKTVAGGGGGSSDAIKYSEQELTDEQKMQARKNQGLYYDFPEETKTVKGSDEGEEYTTVSPHLKKISDDTPEPDAIKAYFYDGAEGEFSINDYGIEQGHGYYTVADTYHTSNYFYVILEQKPLSPYASLPTGIYVNTSSLNSDKRSLEYITKATEVHQIPPKYIKDMYYEEEGAMNIQWDGDTSLESATFRAIAAIGNGITAYKASDLVPSLDDVISYNGQPLFTAKETIANYYSIFNPLAYGNVFIIFKDYEGEEGEVNASKGIYFSYADIPLQINGTIVHKIPEKYLPDMPSGSGAFFVKATYSYPNYTLDKTYAEVAQAIADGMVVILELIQGVAGTSQFFGCNINITNLTPNNRISFAGVASNGVLMGFSLKEDDSFVNDFSIPQMAGIQFQYGSTVLENGCGLIEISSASPVSVSPALIGYSGGFSNGTWSIKKISGSAAFAMTGVANQFSITATESGTSQAIVTCEYTASSILGTLTYRLSAIITAVATI